MYLHIISKDLIPKYYICNTDTGDKVIAHENITSYNIEPVKIDKRTIDMSNKNIGEWHVEYYIGDRKWLCKCSCGRLCAITGYNLKYDKSTSCGHERYNDLRNKSFGEWEVIEYAGVKHGMSMWKCKCSCGNIRDIYAARLLNGRSKSCGHNTNRIKDLTDQTFGEWTVIKYIGNHYWQCRCSCGNIKDIAGYSLIRGDSKSCGHLTNEIRRESMLSKYGDTAVGKHREKWQIDAISSKENFINYIKKRGYKPTADELSRELCINTNNIYRTIHKYELEELIIIDYNSSKYEREIYDIITSITKCKIVQRDKNILHGIELDIYIPEKKLAIEFNGSYWHSEIYKDKYYHQQKTIECAKNGIQLIHIFEHEWTNENTKKKLIRLLKKQVTNDFISIGARKTDITEIDGEVAKEFCCKYHLQGYAKSSVNLGCMYQNELIGVMTLGKPRFSHSYDYELVRLCWRDDIKVVGGASKLFKYFINKYSVTSVISYCDISKFIGNSYLKMGFITDKNSISEPNYIWYNLNNKSILPRYKTQKKHLVDIGLGKDSETETEIMYRNGYVRIFDSGNLVFEWRKEDGSKSTNNVE